MKNVHEKKCIKTFVNKKTLQRSSKTKYIQIPNNLSRRCREIHFLHAFCHTNYYHQQKWIFTKR